MPPISCRTSRGCLGSIRQTSIVIARPLCRNHKTQGFEFCRPSEESAKQFRRILEKVRKLYKKLEILSGGVCIDFASEL